jgi:hypothetical protein
MEEHDERGGTARQSNPLEFEFDREASCDNRDTLSCRHFRIFAGTNL